MDSSTSKDRLVYRGSSTRSQPYYKYIGYCIPASTTKGSLDGLNVVALFPLNITYHIL